MSSWANAQSPTTEPSLPRRRVSLSNVSGGVVEFLGWVGGIGAFCIALFSSMMRPPYERRELVKQMDEMGSKSLPLVLLAGGAIGVVLSLHTRDSLLRFGAKSLLPALIIISIVKESGPLITALVVSGRV